ncbi:MAG: glycosyltransferase [Clostridia bacterium]|nr:glycosyltransferase [Clostridia bacterium]
MRYKGIILNLGKEEIGEIQDEIEGKTESKIKDKFNDEDRKNYLIKDNQEMNKNQKSASPIISIVTPYYNGQDYIDETARSVFNQTFTNFEWIIVDDGSTKEGKEKLKEIEKLDKRIKIINIGIATNGLVLNEKYIDECKNPLSQNSQSLNSFGPAVARDIGIRNSAKSSKYIVFLDADDLYDKTYLECCFWTLETHSKASWTYTDSVNFGAKNFLWRKWYDVEWELKENILLVSACIRKKDLFEVGCFGIKEKKVYEDWYLWVKLIKAGKFPVRMSSLLTYYRQKIGTSELKASNDSNRKRALKIIKDEKRDIVYYKNGIQFPKYDYNWEDIEDEQRISLVYEPGISEMQVLTKNSNPNISRKTKNKKINVLMILPWMVTGGADRFNLNLVKKIDKRKFSFTIVTTLPSSNEWRRQFEKYATVYDLTTFLEMKNWTSFINYIINKNNINLIFNSNSEFGYKILPYLKAKHPQIPICDFVHMEEWYIRNGGFSRDSSSMQNVIDKTFTCNENSRNVFIEHFKRKPEEVKTVYIGVDEKKFNPEKFDKEDLLKKFKYGEELKNKIIISYICRIADQKRPYLFFEVIKKMTEIRDDFVAIVAGDGPMLEGLKRKVKQHRLEKYFIFARKY